MVRTISALVVLCVSTATYGQPTLDEFNDAKAAEKKKADAAAANDSKMAAVDKVISMLKDMRNEVNKEGEAESATYNKFACFCKDTLTDTDGTIKNGQASQQKLWADLQGLKANRGLLDESITDCTGKISELEGAMAQNKRDCNDQKATCEKKRADLKGGIAALGGALRSLKTSKEVSFLQFTSVMKTIQRATLVADALGLLQGMNMKAATFLQAAPKVQMENYQFKSGDVIATLERLEKSFVEQLNDLEMACTKEEELCNGEQQANQVELNAKNKKLASDSAEKAATNENIARTNDGLTQTTSKIYSDQAYLADLNKQCTTKKAEYDQATRVRMEELTALSHAVTIIENEVKSKTSSNTVRLLNTGVTLRTAKAVAVDDDAMEAIEASVEMSDVPAGFLQLRRIRRQPVDDSYVNEKAREAVISILRQQGKKSTLLAGLASRVAADPFAKVKGLISELLDRLLAEESKESTQESYCVKETAAANQKKDYATEAIGTLNSKVAQLQALKNKLNAQIIEVQAELDTLKTQLKKASDQRDAEKLENEAATNEAKAGLQALAKATEIIDRFYKTKVNQETGDGNYQGKQVRAGNVLAMLDIIKSDFERTVDTMDATEAEQAKAFMELETANLANKAAQDKFKAELTTQLGEAETDYTQGDTDLKTQVSILKGAIAELIELKAACIDTAMSYDERVAARNTELAALKKALCILNAYTEYGEDGAKGQC